MHNLMRTISLLCLLAVAAGCQQEGQRQGKKASSTMRSQDEEVIPSDRPTQPSSDDARSAREESALIGMGRYEVQVNGGQPVPFRIGTQTALEVKVVAREKGRKFRVVELDEGTGMRLVVTPALNQAKVTLQLVPEAAEGAMVVTVQDVATGETENTVINWRAAEPEVPADRLAAEAGIAIAAAWIDVALEVAKSADNY
jgi:hypothetical protein